MEFYNEGKAPTSHFVTTDYGHMDILDDSQWDPLAFIENAMCKKCTDPRDQMRRTVGGLIVSF